MLHEYSRMELLVGQEKMQELRKARIAVFGLGGVGSYVVEALARCGVGSLILVDPDRVSLTNINRQLYALQSTIGKQKTEIAKMRVQDICNEIIVHTYDTFFNEETAGLFDFSSYDYVVDAIDTVSSKLLLIEMAKKAEVPVISCMGTGNKLNASGFEITDISKTSVCPLAKVMRTELKKRGIRKVKVLYSKENPLKVQHSPDEQKGTAGRPVPGSISFVPPVAGFLIAGEVIRDLLKNEKRTGKRI